MAKLNQKSLKGNPAKSKPAMTPKEKEVVVENEKKVAEEGVSTERLSLVSNLVSGKFGLDPSYRVTSFKDSTKSVALTLENEDFIVAVTVKDSERAGIFVED